MTVKAFPPTFSPRELVRAVPAWVWQVSAAFLIYLVVSHFILAAYPDATVRVRFSIEPLAAAALAVQVHVVAAIGTFFIGLGLLLAPKGFRWHKTFGWIWVGAMAVTAVSSFFITGIMGDMYSPIHALSAWTLIGLPFGIFAIRRWNIRRHRQTMTGMFIGGMAIAGLFTFLPGRLMWHMFFSI